VLADKWAEAASPANAEHRHGKFSFREFCICFRIFGERSIVLEPCPQRSWGAVGAGVDVFHLIREGEGPRRSRCLAAWVGFDLVYVAICDAAAVRSFDQLWERASIGPIPGEVVLIIGFLFHAGLIVVALLTLKGQLAAGRVKRRARSQ
jgi:hypothetical protein